MSGAHNNITWQQSKKVDPAIIEVFAEFIADMKAHGEIVTYGNLLHACATFNIPPLVFAMALRDNEKLSRWAYYQISQIPYKQRQEQFLNVCESPDENDIFRVWWEVQQQVKELFELENKQKAQP